MARPSHASHVWLFSFVDVLLLLAVVLFSFVFLALPQINPEAKDEDDFTPPGQIAILVCWPAGPIDVDLWTMAPGQKVATGYSAKSGSVWSLLRDDLGTAGDSSPVNCESAFARSLPDGLWVVNLHGYTVPDVGVSVMVEISINGTLFVKEEVAIRPKQERTIAQWRMAGGEVVPDSVSSLYTRLRSANK